MLNSKKYSEHYTISLEFKDKIGTPNQVLKTY